VEQQMQRLTDAYLASVLQLEEYKRRRQELEQRLQSIAEQVRQLEVNVGRHDELAGIVQSIEAFCERVQQGLTEATFEQKRQLIELLVDRVVVTGNEVEIRYVIPTSKSSEQIRFCHLRLDYFDAPMPPSQIEEASRTGLDRGQVGDEVDYLLSGLASLAHRDGAGQTSQPFAPTANGKPDSPSCHNSLRSRGSQCVHDADRQCSPAQSAQ
jgi:site-specific DNA recombinase